MNTGNKTQSFHHLSSPPSPQEQICGSQRLIPRWAMGVDETCRICNRAWRMREFPMHISIVMQDNLLGKFCLLHPFR